MYFAADPLLGFKLEPNSVGRYHLDIEARANQFGHRDDPVTLNRTPGVYRILLLGDSFTVGANVRQREAYGQVLERLLSSKSKRKIEVVNSAVGGWGPLQYVNYLEHYGFAFEPNMVVIGFFVGNDTYNAIVDASKLSTAVLGRRIRRQALSRWTKSKIWLYNNSHLVRHLLVNGARDKFHYIRESCEKLQNDWHLRIQRRRLHNHLRRDGRRLSLAKNSIALINRAKTLTEAKGIPLVIILIPDENQINRVMQDKLVPAAQRARYDFEMPQSMLRKEFARLGIRVFDLLPYFLSDKRCLYMDDTHWTAEGHKLAAQRIANYVLREFGLSRHGIE